MTKFFYFFLLNLLLLSKRNEFDARLLDPRTLAKNKFKIEDSEFHGIENLSKAFARKSGDSYSEEGKGRGNELKVKRHFSNYEGMKKPFASFSSQNFQKYPFPQNDVETNPVQLECMNDNEYTEMMARRKEGSFHSNEFFKWRRGVQDKKMVKRGIPLRCLVGSEKVRRYLDYTNSQMPFNEGMIQRNNNQAENPNHKIADETSKGGTEKFNHDNNPDPNMNDGRLRRTMSTHPEALEIPGDGSILEYSRVRRYLDQERVKKRVRSTLEAKEAAMSGVLDPNLNLDGILEPHVRKRRGHLSKKRDLSSKFRNKRRGKRRKKLITVD